MYRLGMKHSRLLSEGSHVQHANGLVAIFVPASGQIIAPWQKSESALPEDDQVRLDMVVERIASLSPWPRTPVWMWPDRGPVVIESGSRTWLLHWSRDRACYSRQGAPFSPGTIGIRVPA